MNVIIRWRLMHVSWLYITVKSGKFFFSKVTHKVSRTECLLYVRIKKTTMHYKNLFVFRTRKAKFVIICHSDLIPPTNIPAVSQKEISYFGPGKKRSPLFYSRKWGWVISAYLWDYLVFLQKKKKKKKSVFILPTI